LWSGGHEGHRARGKYHSSDGWVFVVEPHAEGGFKFSSGAHKSKINIFGSQNSPSVYPEIEQIQNGPDYTNKAQCFTYSRNRAEKEK
jgi:hypothetical protein